MLVFFFFNDTATPEIYTLSLHDALPILARQPEGVDQRFGSRRASICCHPEPMTCVTPASSITNSVINRVLPTRDRKSTRLNSSHANISYAVFCLKKKKITHTETHKLIHI